MIFLDTRQFLEKAKACEWLRVNRQPGDADFAACLRGLWTAHTRSIFSLGGPMPGYASFVDRKREQEDKYMFEYFPDVDRALFEHLDTIKKIDLISVDRYYL